MAYVFANSYAAIEDQVQVYYRPLTAGWLPVQFATGREVHNPVSASDRIFALLSDNVMCLFVDKKNVCKESVSLGSRFQCRRVVFDRFKRSVAGLKVQPSKN